jgi:uncharacterized cupredoxin-like copper-binding protein
MAPEERSSGAVLRPTLVGVLSALLVCAGILIGGLLARPTGGIAVPKGDHVVHITEADFKIGFPKTSLAAGKYVFVDKNEGPSEHEFVMWKTKDEAAELPLDGKDVDEESDELEGVIDSGSALKPGETRLLTADLDPGHYVVVCNLPGHYMDGMHVDINVS